MFRSSGATEFWGDSWFYKHSVPPGLETEVTENWIELIRYEKFRNTTLVNRRGFHASNRRQAFRDRRPGITTILRRE